MEFSPRNVQDFEECINFADGKRYILHRDRKRAFSEVKWHAEGIIILQNSNQEREREREMNRQTSFRRERTTTISPATNEYCKCCLITLLSPFCFKLNDNHRKKSKGLYGKLVAVGEISLCKFVKSHVLYNSVKSHVCFNFVKSQTYNLKRHLGTISKENKFHTAVIRYCCISIGTQKLIPINTSFCSESRGIWYSSSKIDFNQWWQ